MSRWHDEDDVRVQADKLHEINNGRDAMYLFKKGRSKANARRDKVSQALRGDKTTADIAFKAEVERRARITPVTLPKIGDSNG